MRPWDWGPDGLPVGWPQDYGIPTLGPGALAWGETELVQPDGEFTGDPWRWTESQGRYVCWWYALDCGPDQEAFRRPMFLFRRGQIVLPKGAGKSPIAAALSLLELAGPVRFGGWADDGEPIGVPHPSPHVQLAAVSKEQAGNTMDLAIAMVAPGSHARQSITGLDPGLTRVRTAHGKLQPVTASSKTREGQRATAAVADETHLWTSSNGGKDLVRTLRRNLAKMNGRMIETTNAWLPGAGSVAEDTYDYALKIQAGEIAASAKDDAGVLRWHPQAQITEDDIGDRELVREALEELYADSPWIDIDRQLEEIFDLGEDPQDAMRFKLNMITAASSAWLSQPDWMACHRPGIAVAARDVVTLGFDGSRGRAKGKPDATALVACRVLDGYVWPVGVWEAPDTKSAWPSWSPPVPEIEAALEQAFRTWTVAALYADPGKDWRAYIGAWEARWGSKVKVRASRDHPFEWWMTGGRAGLVERAIEETEGAIRNRDLCHPNDYRLTAHVLAAHRRLSHGKLALGKAHDYSPHKIDAAVAMVLAWQARVDAIAAGAGRKKTAGVPKRIR